MRFSLLIAFANAAQYCYWVDKMKECEGHFYAMPSAPCLGETDPEQLGVDFVFDFLSFVKINC